MYGHAAASLAWCFADIKDERIRYLIHGGIAVGGLIALVIVVRMLLWMIQRMSLGKLARKLGFEHAWIDSWELPKKSAFLPLFSKSKNGKIVGAIYHGTREGVEIWFFDYRYRRTYGLPHLFRYRTTVVLMEMNYNFPFFYLRYEKLSDKVAALVGHNDIDDFNNKKFNSKYYVKSADRGFAHDLMTDEMVDFVMSKTEGERINIEMTRSLMAFHLEKRLYGKKLKWLYDFGWEFWEKTPEAAVSRSR